jgi:Cys-tRNA(Pro)/Cys-tRNA(Cys) deacylase
MEGLINKLDELTALLEKKNVSFEIIHNKKPIYSVEDARGYYEISQTAPTLVIKTERGFFALILAGDRGRVDFELAKKSLQCEKAKLASKQEVLETTGYDAGSVPLVGHGLPCILDMRLFLHPFIYGGAGDANFTLKIDPRDIEKINDVVAKIV